MLYPSITKLYMYRPSNAHTLDILINDRLWAPKPERFNDPFDCDLEYAKGFTEKDYLSAICQKHGKRDQWPSEIVQQVELDLGADGKFTSEKWDQVNKVIQEELIEKTKTLELYVCQRYATQYSCGPIMHKGTRVFALSLPVPKTMILAM